MSINNKGSQNKLFAPNNDDIDVKNALDRVAGDKLWKEGITALVLRLAFRNCTSNGDGAPKVAKYEIYGIAEGIFNI